MPRIASYFLSYILITFATASSANVVIPALPFAGLSMIFYPLILLWVFASESIIYVAFSKAPYRGAAWSLAIAANITSWFAGAILMHFLPMPDGYMDGVYPPTPDPTVFVPTAILGIIIAYLLSLFIEYGLLKAAAKRFRTSPFKISLIANSVSYLGLTAILGLKHSHRIEQWLSTLNL